MLCGSYAVCLTKTCAQFEKQLSNWKLRRASPHLRQSGQEGTSSYRASRCEIMSVKSTLWQPKVNHGNVNAFVVALDLELSILIHFKLLPASVPSLMFPFVYVHPYHLQIYLRGIILPRDGGPIVGVRALLPGVSVF